MLINLNTVESGALNLLVSTPSWGTVQVDAFGTGLLFQIDLVQVATGHYFYGVPTVVTNLDGLVSQIMFDGGATGHAIAGGVACDNCGIGGALMGYAQSSHVSFFVDGELLAQPIYVRVFEQIFLGDPLCPVVAVGSVSGLAAVPEPATWLLVLFAFAMLATMWPGRNLCNRRTQCP